MYAFVYILLVEVNSWFVSVCQTWGQLLSNVIDYITIILQFS
jgi:hypothetical protein